MARRLGDFQQMQADLYRLAGGVLHLGDKLEAHRQALEQLVGTSLRELPSGGAARVKDRQNEEARRQLAWTEAVLSLQHTARALFGDNAIALAQMGEPRKLVVG